MGAGSRRRWHAARTAVASRISVFTVTLMWLNGFLLVVGDVRTTETRIAHRPAGVTPIGQWAWWDQWAWWFDHRWPERREVKAMPRGPLHLDAKHVCIQLHESRRWARLSSGGVRCAQDRISGTYLVGGDEIWPVGHDTEEEERAKQTARRPAGVTPIGRWAGWTSGLPKLPHDPQEFDAFWAET